MSTQLAVQQTQPSFDETMKLAKAMAASGFFDDSRDAAKAVVKILAGRELGFGAVASMTGINIIRGRVALSANLIAAAIKRSNKYNYRVVEMDDSVCSIDFFENGQRIGNSTFTIEDAKRAKLVGENWQKYPRNMLFARAVSNGARWYCPDLSGGSLYTPDELGAEVDAETGEVISQKQDYADQPVKTYGTPETFMARVNELTGGFYDNESQIIEVIGEYPDWTDKTAVYKAGETAVNYAKAVIREMEEKTE